MDKLEVIRARCGAALKRRLADYAQGRELSESDVLRLALRDYLDRHAPAARPPARGAQARRPRSNR
jgi:predicted transcriptional regulator